jgi:hypothetical protein
MTAYRAWKAWNAARIKLLQKCDREQRAVDALWKPEDAHKRVIALCRLVKVLEQIADHEKNYVPSSATYNSCRAR